jgi:hypothetical protein
LKGWAVTRDSGDGVFIVDLLTEPKRYTGILKSLENALLSEYKGTIRLWLPERWGKYIRGYTVHETPVVVTNMVWKLPLKTATAKENLYYTMGDADIF